MEEVRRRDVSCERPIRIPPVMGWSSEGSFLGKKCMAPAIRLPHKISKAKIPVVEVGLGGVEGVLVVTELRIRGLSQEYKIPPSTAPRNTGRALGIEVMSWGNNVPGQAPVRVMPRPRRRPPRMLPL